MGRRKESDNYSLTKIEELVLMAIINLLNDAYGVTIRRTIEASGESVSLGAIYFALERMEGRGFVRSELGAPLDERGGRAKRYFYITNAGRAALQEVAGRRGVLSRVLNTERQIGGLA